MIQLFFICLHIIACIHNKSSNLNYVHTCCCRLKPSQINVVRLWQQWGSPNETFCYWPYSDNKIITTLILQFSFDIWFFRNLLFLTTVVSLPMRGKLSGCKPLTFHQPNDTWGRCWSLALLSHVTIIAVRRWWFTTQYDSESRLVQILKLNCHLM